MMKRLMFAASILLAATGLGACGNPSGPQTSQASVECRKTEQKGCLEIDVLNLQAPQNFNVQKDGKPYGPTYYDKYLKGELQAAAPRSMVAYVWDIDPKMPANFMAEYRLPADYRAKVNANREKRLTTPLTPLSVTEISPQSGPTFGTVYNIGPPQRAFRISIPNAGTGLQFPRSMFGKNSYVLICPENSDGLTVYPDRITRQDGYWLTPRDINTTVDYIVIPLLFNQHRNQGVPIS